MNVVYIVTVNSGVNTINITTYHDSPTSVFEYISTKRNYYLIYRCLDHDKFCDMLENAVFGFVLNSVGLELVKEKLQ